MFINVNTDEEVLVQNSLTSKVPEFCGRPTWYVSGCEKKVKIGRQSFNYIDYLEAYCHHDCGTHRREPALINIRQQIQAAIDEMETIQQPKRR